MSLFNRNTGLRNGLTKMPGKSVYFKALLPSCARSLEALSLRELTFHVWHLPSAQRDPRIQP